MESDIVRRGYLKVAGEGFLFAAAKKRWITLREKSVKGETRLEIFSNEKAEREGESVKQCVNLAHAKHASRHKQKHSFVIELSALQAAEEMVFLCESEADADDWVEAINRQLVRGNTLRQGNLPTTTAQFASRSSDQQMFRVNPQNLHNKLGIQPGAICMLKVTDDRIILFDSSGTRHQAEWYLAALRKYGRTPEYIQFEAGRRCATGEGIFTMLTSDGEAIYQLLHANAQRLAVGAGVAPSSSLGSTSSRSQNQATSNPAGSSDYEPLSISTIERSVYAPLGAANAQDKSIYQPLTGQQTEAVYSGVGDAVPAAPNHYQPLTPGTRDDALVYSEATTSSAKPQQSLYEPLKESTPKVDPTYQDVAVSSSLSTKAPPSEYAPLSTATQEKPVYQALGDKAKK